jgi:hypothetical protein
MYSLDHTVVLDKLVCDDVSWEVLICPASGITNGHVLLLLSLTGGSVPSGRGCHGAHQVHCTQGHRGAASRG